MKPTRRNFIKYAGGSLLAFPTMLSAATETYLMNHQPRKRAYSANDRIQIACIGMGIMGFNNCQTALKIPGVQLVAACDLYSGRLDRAREVFGSDVSTTKNYRSILERTDIDAVIVATSDHWHDHISIAALEAGKAVYCEKPMVHRIEEGKAMIAAEQKSGLPLQVGSQRVSSLSHKKAKQLYQAGEIGDLVLVEAWTDRQSALGAWQYSIPTDAGPETVDWDSFQGDAPKQPYDANRFFRWRNYQDYGTGVAGDLFVHLFSGLHTILDSKGPDRIYASGGLRYWKDGRDVPDVMLAIFDYPATNQHPAFNFQLRCNFIDGKGGGSMLRLIGTEGVMEVYGQSLKVARNKVNSNPTYGGWDSFNTFTAEQQKAFEEWHQKTYPSPSPEMIGPNVAEYLSPKGFSAHLVHHQTFIDAVRGEGKIFEDGTFGLRAAAPSLAANESYFTKQMIHWDPVNMELIK